MKAVNATSPQKLAPAPLQVTKHVAKLVTIAILLAATLAVVYLAA